ncbi:polyprenyl synthetase family protein [Sphaerisporangium aureirubrum]|uniref:Polyprenyl synthetase family protein n=1 Tax=Sphaerisporangium aureirubrum TaxID=1544736 RepID=A0ABW1NI08_9ACTN
MTPLVPPALPAARELVAPALRAAVGLLDPVTRRVAAYHLGWADHEGRPADAGGKALRPALAVLSARAAGAPPDLPSAAAVELVHAFSLLHDDIMDGDRVRRHRPAAWTLFGRSEAILAGDALLALAGELLAAAGTPGHAAAAHSLSAATRRLIAGQAMDLEFERRAEVGLEECLRMSADKTGALLACSCAIGALAAGAPPALPQALAAFGAEAGLAFQLVDDLLGIWGSPETTGKPVLSDLRARKKTLPVVAALTGGTPAGARLAGLLAGPGPLAEYELREAARLVEDAGGRAWAEAEAKHRLDVAQRHLADAVLPPSVRTEFLDIAAFITARDH